VKIGRSTAATDTGRRRMRNEDAYVFEPPLFAIADGMGGARAGEVAAGIAAAALKDGRSSVSDEDSLEAVIDEANRRVWQRSMSDPGTSGMGTTVTVAFVDAANERVVFGQVGDSRAYRLRGDTLEQVTTDHSLVAELVRSGVLTPEEAERHPQRSAITRAVGTESAIDADVFSVPAELGDVYLLCSDGLTDMLGADEIAAAILEADRDPVVAADALVAGANARGGEDNITVVLFELVEGEAQPETETELETDGETESDAEVAPEAQPAATTTAAASDDDVSTHGAGSGGRLAAIALLVILLAVAALVLYWSVKR
jgi:PPM family protein phosphatase